MPAITMLSAPPSKGRFKKWARGTATTVKNGSDYIATITGLTFTPRVVVADFLIGTDWYRVVQWSPGGVSSLNGVGYMTNLGGDVTPNVRVDNVSYGTFRLVGGGSVQATVTWEAFGD